MLHQELANRSRSAGFIGVREIFKSIPPSEMNGYFDRGWSFVSAFQTDAITACNKSGKKTPGSISHDSRCTACGEHLSWVKFNEHFITIQPITVVIKRQELKNADSLTNESVGDLLFDASFG